MPVETELVPHDAPRPSAALADLAAKATDYAKASKAANTLRAYDADWRDFAAWCDDKGVAALPAEPETVALYLAAQAETLKPSTLQRRMVAIGQVHQAKGLPSPTKAETVRTVMKGIRRIKGTAPAKKEPASIEDLRRMLQALPDGPHGLRDRALLLIGFAGALRRSELVGLDVVHVNFTREGLVITLARSKTDQEAEGKTIGIPYGAHTQTCPIRALKAWLRGADITEGPIFRPITRWGLVRPVRLSGKAVALVVKRYALAAGRDPEDFASHSLRSGFITTAAVHDVPERDIMRQSRHKSIPVMRGYIQDASLFKCNAAGKVGL
jgi:site-specific recombinase XerD